MPNFFLQYEARYVVLRSQGIDDKIIYIKGLAPCLGSGSLIAVDPGLYLSPLSPRLSPSPQALTHEFASQSEILSDLSLLYVIKAVVKISFLVFVLFSDDVR